MEGESSHSIIAPVPSSVPVISVSNNLNPSNFSVMYYNVSGLTPLTDRLSPDQYDSPPPNWNKKTINYKMTGCIDNGHFKGPKNADDVP